MRKIFYSVLFVHSALVLLMMLFSPKKPRQKKAIEIQTIVLEQKKEEKIVAAPKPRAKPSPNPKPNLTPKKREAPKKATKVLTPKKQPKAPVVQKPRIAPSLLQELNSQLAKLDAPVEPSAGKTKALKTPKWIPSLKVDEEVEKGYTLALIAKLQQSLDLPEVGEVKIALTLNANGRVLQINVLESASAANRTFLEKELKMLHFPLFTGALKKEKEHTFVITFCNL